MKGGYTGKMLFVDLSEGRIETRDLSEETAQRFVGGYGIGARVLYDVMKPGVDPLGPQAVLGFVTGPLNGTGALFGGRYAVVCKSPVTGGWNDANAGGHFGPELKKAGFDAVFVSGAAERPVYIYIEDGKAEIRDAAGLWGKMSVEALESLVEETGQENLRAAVIGPAGEKQSLLACIINDRHRAAGRGGAGAVMGSKKLKAIAVKGTGEVAVADPDKLKEANRMTTDGMKNGSNAETVKGYSNYGTGMGTSAYALSGDSPVKNWGGVGIRDFGEASAKKIDSIALEKFKKKKYACSSCPLGCGAFFEVNEGEWPLGETFRPEYETAAAFGTLCLNDNAASIMKCNHICNEYGLDTISTGATVAWAIECSENGLFTRKDTGGIELAWGNAKAIVEITQAIADRTGFGDVLALGSAKAAEKLGKGAEFLQTVKGMELPMHDPRFAPGYTRTYQFDPSPARHVKGGLGGLQARDTGPAKYDSSDTGAMDMMLTGIYEVLQVSGICLFSLFAQLDLAPRMLEAVTGWNCDNEFQTSATKRILNMRHAFNLREGQKPADFAAPKRSVGDPPQTEGPLAGCKVDHVSLKRNFFAAMGWDETTGKPSRESLEALGGLEDVVQDLYG